jgi:hypothetical protein
MAELTFCEPPAEFRAVFQALLDRVDWRPLNQEGLAPPPEGTVRATHRGAIQVGQKSMRCYKLTTGQQVFNGEDMAALIGVSVEALSDERKFEEERSRGQ